jgi:2-iminobutanoate/2-iminopropanoate deaminase
MRRAVFPPRHYNSEGVTVKMLQVLVGLIVCAATSGVSATQPPRYIVKARTPERSGLPFSDAVFVGNTLYVSGHLSADPNTGKVPEDTEAEVKMVMDSVQQTLKASGLTTDDLVSVTVYCTDLALYDKFNLVYKSYFHGKFPTRAFIGVATLLRGAHFEVQGIAVRSGTNH